MLTLLKFHIVFSLLCLFVFLWLRSVFREEILNNGWTLTPKSEKQLKDRILEKLTFFIPLLNVVGLIAVILAIMLNAEDLTSRK